MATMQQPGDQKSNLGKLAGRSDFTPKKNGGPTSQKMKQVGRNMAPKNKKWVPLQGPEVGYNDLQNPTNKPRVSRGKGAAQRGFKSYGPMA